MKRLACLMAVSFFWVAIGPQAFAQQPDEVTQLLQTLADAPGPPGFEEAVRQIMVARMRPFPPPLSVCCLGIIYLPAAIIFPYKTFGYIPMVIFHCLLVTYILFVRYRLKSISSGRK
jgi:hypothetical protein